MALAPVTEALRRALSLVAPGPTELRRDVLGLFLAEPVFAPRDIPGCDNSAMDGYAVRAQDTKGATRDQPAALQVVGTVYAGQAPAASVGPGQAMRIFTGAQVPEGADAVVRQEAAHGDGGRVEVFVEAAKGDHVRRRGEEIAQGAQVFGRGQRVNAFVEALLRSLGRTEARVFLPVPVAVLTVGDELVDPGAPALPHQIYESNGTLLAGLVRECNGQVVWRQRAKDEPAALAEALRAALGAADFVLTSGGASVGDKDLVKAAVRELGGAFAVDGVALKPGKPVGVAQVGGKVVIVLPGNPGAATVAFDRLARPLLFARQGVREVRRTVAARLDAPKSKQAGLTYFLSARLEDRSGDSWARVRPQGSGQLLQNVDMDGWVVLPPRRDVFAEGELVDFELTQGARFVPLDGPEEDAPRQGRGTAPAISLIGWSGAGKTTLIEALLGELQARGLKVAVLKHTGHAHPLHKEGSDTARFEALGADPVAFASGQRTQVSRRADAGSALATLRQSGVDLVLVEGWKDGPLPKIELRARDAEPILAQRVEWVLDADAARDVGAVTDRLLALCGAVPKRRED